ncbi:MAG: DNA internalization-related competence protein ComEC/Rec2 [Polaromonas sp.]|nr:DNA internalization-related competence protein ComEC/Rec2 [Polaromonas sp.]
MVGVATVVLAVCLKWRGSTWLGVVMAVVLGFGLTGWRATEFERHALNPVLEGQDLLVTGMVRAMPQRSDEALRFRLVVESAQQAGQTVMLPPQILLGWYSGFGGRSSLPNENTTDPDEWALALQRQPQNLRAGERWQMTVRLKAPHGNSNPHGFDYELWLWEQGIQATGYVRAGVRDDPPVKLAATWAYPVERARQSVREAIDQRIADRHLSGVLAALVVGDQGAIQRADWDVFRTTGVAHLMSISGLHITMFAWVASLCIGAVWRRSARVNPRLCLAIPACTAGALGGLVLAFGYGLFSGWGVPAQRTIWMLAVVVALRVGGLRWPPVTTWLLAMAVVVAADPWALMQAGFWLSFVAVGVLFATDVGANNSTNTRANDVYLLNIGSRRWQLLGGLALQRIGAGLLAGLREQWVVTLALTPLSLLLFNQVSLVGLLANAVAIPWVTLVVTPLAMAGVLFAPLLDGAAWAVHSLTLLLQALARWPLASINVPSAPLWAAVAGVLGGVLMALRLPLGWRLLGLPLLIPVLWWQPQGVPAGQFELLAADIGQGNAVLVRTATHALLYDTGPRYSPDSDAGQRVLVPLLTALGVQLNVLMLSHRDSDHIGGAPAVLAMQPGAQLLSSIEDRHPLQMQRRAHRCVAGQQWVWDGVTFDVLHPAASDYGEAGQAPKSNAMSCVLRISTGLQTALLVGDIEQPQEARLVAQLSETGGGGPLKADILLMPHHGSKTSSSGAFLDAVQPRIALAQAGYRNRFNHPVPVVVARYDERHIRVVASPACGAAIWQSERPEEVSCQRQNAPRYWHHAGVRSP